MSGADGEIRTLTDGDLNAVPLPIGLRRLRPEPTLIRAVAIVQSLTPQIALSAGVIALGSRRLRVPAALLTAAASWRVWSVLRPTRAHRHDGPGLRIAGANLLYTNPDVAPAAGTLARLDAEVVVLVEFTPEHAAVLRDHPLADAYPHRIEDHGRGPKGIAVWSRLPVTRVDDDAAWRYRLDVDVATAEGPLRLIAVHTTTPLEGPLAWRRQFQHLLQTVRSAPARTVVLGDFNASTWHPALRRLLRTGLVDAHVADGRGLGASWPTDRVVPPFVRLDHALVGPGLVSGRVDDVDVPGSDHRAFSVEIAAAENVRIAPAG